MDQLNQTENQQNNNGGQAPRIRSRQVVQSFEAKFIGKKTFGEEVADYCAAIFGSINFFIFNLILFVIWIIWNLGLIPKLPVFDPFPFNLLTMAVSLEAIFLSILVLVSQNQEAKIDKLRSEVDLQINMIAEQEITKILSLLTILMERQGINVTEDPEVQKMLKKIDLGHIEKKIEEQLNERATVRNLVIK